MSDVPSHLRYTESHEWIHIEDDGSARIGITDHAQEALGDLVFVELPEVGSALGQGDAAAVVESVKAASDVYSPLSGEVAEVNEALEDDPAIINTEPYGDGWLFTLSLEDDGELEGLMDAETYAQNLEE